MAAFEEDFQAWRKSRAELLLDDFGELCRYREANAALKPACPGESRVVFFGDSITEGWNLEEHFPASLTSTAAFAPKPRRKCWSGSGRTLSLWGRTWR